MLSQEIEWKYTVAESFDPASIPEFFENSGIIASSSAHVSLLDCYFDTEDWRLFRAGAACRLRRENDRTWLTLKSLTPMVNGISRRFEMDEQLSSYHDPITELNCESLLGQRIRGVAGPLALQPLFTVTTQRTLYVLTISPDTTASLCFDVVGYGENGSGGCDREVEMELVSGSFDEAREFANRLAGQLSLAVNELSKFEKGLALSDLHPPLLVPESVEEPKATDSCLEAALAIMRKHFELMRRHEPGTRLGIDPEHLHNMRVSIRRLRAALQVFRTIFPSRTVKDFRAELKWIADCLGKVRDLDVHIHRLEDDIRHMDEAHRQVLQEFYHWMQAERERAWTEMIAALNSDRYAQWLAQFEDFLTNHPDSSAFPKPASRPIAAKASRCLRKRYRKVRRDGRQLAKKSPDKQIHEFRIDCKKLRYLCEFLQPIYGKSMRKMARRAARLQDRLGLHQDFVMSVQTLKAYLSTLPESQRNEATLLEAQSRLIHHYHLTSKRNLQRFFKVWKEFDRKSKYLLPSLKF